MQSPDDRVDLRDESGRAHARRLVDSTREDAVVPIAADGPERHPVVDRLRADGDRAEERIELAPSHISQSVRLDVVAHEPRGLREEGDVLAGHLEPALDVRLRGAATTAAEALARELLQALDGGALPDEEALGDRSVGLCVVEPGHPVTEDSDRRDRDVPAIAPVAADDLAPCRGDEARLDPEAPCDQLARVGVEAGHLICRQLVRRALGVGQPLRALDLVGLRWVRRIGRKHQRPARLHLGQLVGGRISGHARRRHRRHNEREGNGDTKRGRFQDCVSPQRRVGSALPRSVTSPTGTSSEGSVSATPRMRISERRMGASSALPPLHATDPHRSQGMSRDAPRDHGQANANVRDFAQATGSLSDWLTFVGVGLGTRRPKFGTR